LIFLGALTKFIAEFIKKFRISSGTAEYLELKIGEKVPLFREKDQLKRDVVLSKNNGKYTLLLFAQRECIYCKEIISNIGDFTEIFDLRLIVVSEEKLGEEFFQKNIHFITSKMIFKDYMIKSVPTIMLLDPRNHLLTTPKYDHAHGLRIYLGNYFRENTYYNAN
jgi:thioredoxin-related protein